MEGVKQQPRWRSDQSLERGVYQCVCVCGGDVSVIGVSCAFTKERKYLLFPDGLLGYVQLVGLLLPCRL